MSRLDELIAELCPNGVPVVELGDVIKFLNGRAYKQEELLTNGKYKVLRVGNFFTNESWYYSNLELSDDKFCYDGDLLYAWAASLGPQIWHGGKTIFHYHIWKLLFDESVIDKRFLFHFLKKDIDSIKNSLTNSTMPHVSMKNMKARVMPLPPLPVQEEIVRILDNFTELSNELSAELSARKKQYDYYMDRLLTFGDTTPKVLIGDILTRTKGTKITALQMKQLHKKNGKLRIFAGGKTIADVDFCDIPEKDINYNPSIIVKSRGNIEFEYYDKPFSHKNEFWSYYSANESVSIKFVYYYLVQNIGYFQQVANSMQMPQISIPVTDKFEIPLPEIEEQYRIVEILDRFDSLCNDLTHGLPAEIEARRKQYEYYRDRLLTFKELQDK